ncbi:MAG TPA: amidohydrolase [Candidatus Acidoferrales bacterium]|nr:amidohydrolase [Candidatus Acidoferrales bacterium]
MRQTSRREFLGSVGALGALALVPPVKTEPDLVLYNGNIHTVNDQLPHAEAVAISGGRFLAVGANAEVLALATGRTRKIDIGLKTILPGFIDAHSHPSQSGREHLRMVACDLTAIAQIQAALRARAAKTPAGQWVQGFLYDDTKTERPITRQDLDAAVPDHPAIVHHRGGHTAFVNSLALGLAKVDERTPDPPGGRFFRDAAGRLNGRVADRANAVFYPLINSPYTREERRQGCELISKMMTAKGVTSAGDANASPEDLEAYQDARDAGGLRMRVYVLIGVAALDRMIAAGVRTGFGNRWVRVGAVKQFADGSISERTARLSAPYAGTPDYYGLLTGTKEELYENARKAHAAGWQLATHANGDVAIDEILTIYERVQKEAPRRDPRFRIEHCTLINDSLIRRMRALGAIPVPFSCYVYFHGEKMHFYGAERLKQMFAMRSFIDAGLRPPDSSDYTASPFDPRMWLQSQVTRTDPRGNVWGPNQRISVAEAIRCGTINGAYASYEEHLKGSIEPGKLADLVVLGRDPLREPPSSLTTLPIERTMVEGRWRYEA